MIKGYENVSDEQANKIVLSIKKTSCSFMRTSFKTKKEKNETDDSSEIKIILLNTENDVSEIEYRKQA
ncbi:MAG: hypothetical protein IPG89_19190 [Bacteroidetes bacterium]|nr:hypothetical protein [Bacteroidota bacterium]